MSKPKFELGTSGNLVLLHAAKLESGDGNDLRDRFIGVLSCYVPASTWEFCIAQAKEQMKPKPKSAVTA